MILVWTMVFMITASMAWAKESPVGILQGQALPVKQEEKLKPVAVVEVKPQTQEKASSDVDEFIQEEEKRIKNIRLMGLELEKSNILLKQKEIEVKLAELNKGGASSSAPLLASASSATEKRLIALTVTQDYKEAMIKINGRPTLVHEGDAVGEGKAAVIDEQGVNILYSDGKEEHLGLNL